MILPDASWRHRAGLATLAEALGALGAPVESVIVPGASHEDTVLKLAQPFARDSRVIDPMLAFLAAQDRASAPVQPPVR